MSTNQPLVVIVGPTASGKSSLAMRVAEKFNGEIICADSRTIYKGMDVGTAKPSAVDQLKVPHWGLDLVEPGERFTVADFKDYVVKKIAETRSRGKLPMLVGGTGLYIDAVVFDYKFGDTDLNLRSKLEKLSLDELLKWCKEYNIILPENTKNRRYLIRAIEQGGASEKGYGEIIDNTVVVGIATEKATLNKRIEDRAEQLFADGVVEEAIKLGKKYGWDNEAMTGNIYRLTKMYIDGKISRTELKERFIISDRQLAKKQLTFMKRNEHIKWLSLEEAENYLTNFLGDVLL